ncbi:flagellin N-terminal helical domain-containing protein [Brucella anthropi]|uniref:flagellin N-terminal helical domain-containing protein n=1 Tax=Brucella anthropi TaxID=529 RepID=UPI001CFEBC8D|nr:flagellin [Brucella anthropi]
MASIITNNASVTALQTLKTVQGNLTETQSRVSTGLKVQSAKDNAAYYSIAQTMRGDSAAFNSLSENLSIAGASVSVARQGTEELGKITKQILEKVSLAQANESVDRTLIQKDIASLVEQFHSTVAHTSYNGQSLLDGPGTVTVVTGITREGGDFKTTNFTFEKFDHTDVSSLLDTLDVSTPTHDAFSLRDLLTTVESNLAAITEAEANFGMVEKRIDNHKSFNSKLVDKFDAGVGSLVDADMNKEAARLSALQVQEQLATQALSIANQAPQSILSLFR